MKESELVMTFTEALYSQDLEAIRSFPKADLHNHFVLGGSREYIFHKTGHKIDSITTPLKSMSEMDSWSSRYIGNRFNSPEGREFLIKATFEQAKSDGVTILEIGEDVWGLGMWENGAHHPIAQLYRKGVDVTIGSDDVLIFDSDVSKEYLRLYQSGGQQYFKSTANLVFIWVCRIFITYKSCL